MSLILQADNLPGLRILMMRSIVELQRTFLSPEEVVASFELMGMDTQLFADGTYFVVRTLYFGTADQPNKPARVTMQVAALVAPGMMAEIEV